jgi:hypothetical protein
MTIYFNNSKVAMQYPMFPAYNLAGNNQPHVSVLGAMLENGRLANKSVLTEPMLSGSGHSFLSGYINIQMLINITIYKERVEIIFRVNQHTEN